MKGYPLQNHNSIGHLFKKKKKKKKKKIICTLHKLLFISQVMMMMVDGCHTSRQRTILKKYALFGTDKLPN